MDVPLLTYLAQVRQLPFKSDKPLFHHVFIMLPFLPIKPSKRHGVSRKAIATIGIVPDVAWVGRSRNMGAWSMVVVCWQKDTICISSPLHAEGRKSPMNTPRKTMDVGLTGFWMRAGQNGNVRVVNGTMYKLLNAKNACILTRILSPHFARLSLQSHVNERRCVMPMVIENPSFPTTYGLIGLKARSRNRGWASNTTLVSSKAQKAQAAMSPSIYLNPPFSRLTGLKDGSALDTVKDFQKRQNGKPTR